MNTGINLPAVFIANIMGVILNFLLLSGGKWRIAGTDKEKKYIRVMLICAMIACVCDPVSFYTDGRPGRFAHFVVYITNMWLYCSNMIIGPAWLYLLSCHLTGGPHKQVRIINFSLCVLGCIFLAVNFFTPIVFSVDSANVYHRGSLFWFYFALEILYVCIGIATYIRCKLRGGVMKFFPVLHFILPAIIGILIQAFMYGVSTIWPFISISVVCLVSSLQNEMLYRDELTGLFNRLYLDRLKREIAKAENGVITGMMMDMNGFKAINDRYGHSEGDTALKTAAGIISGVIGSRGNAIRYGGDEFIVLLNTDNEKEALDCIEMIHEQFRRYNKASSKPYSLSMSIGYKIMDMKKHTIDELMHEVDHQMYENKRLFYSKHPSANRRAPR